MANLDVALATIASTIQATLASASGVIPGSVFVGWPTAEDLHTIAQSSPKTAQVSVWPLDAGKGDPMYRSAILNASAITAGTTASIDSTNQILTIGGAPKAGDTVHAFFSHPLVDAYYEVVNGDTPATIAAALQAAALAYAIPGVTVAISGTALTMEGAYWSRVNVGGTGTLLREINRYQGPVQVSVWAPDAASRSAIMEAILASVGGTQQTFLSMPDGTALRIKFSHPKAWDKAQQQYSVYRWDLIFDVEFGITQSIQVSQVGGTFLGIALNSSAPLTIVSGG
ncbi:MAG TPA: hypothetical protein VFN49_03735 [Candidatus Aquilonibacter sp.]|nr:hypothetical protein [Candidatus Aquilonibacter sp.]